MMTPIRGPKRLIPRLTRHLQVSLRKFDDISHKLNSNEFQKAANDLKNQIEQLEKSIKGETHIRANLTHMTSFPTATKTTPRVDNLSNLFEETIKTTGPISLSAYMRQCLTHPTFGYYTTRNPLDTENGDFITSPEISSVFGEMIGVYFLQLWTTQGQPPEINMIEFGPGLGTLMNDVITSFNRLNKFGIKINVIMIETSRVLRKQQFRKLCSDVETEYINGDTFDSAHTKWGNRIFWIENETDLDLIDVNSKCNYVIAHEFFDALPIKSFQKTAQGWREFLVEHSPSVEQHQLKLPLNESLNDKYDTEFHLTLSPNQTPSSAIPEVSPRFQHLPEGSRIEICPDSELFITKMAQLVNNDEAKGGVLVIDYGIIDGIPQNSLRGIYKHKIVSPFYKPGDVDLSIDVDFDNLKLLSTPIAHVVGPVEQGDWLHEIGIGYRIDQLIRSTNDEREQENIYNAYKRLTGKDDASMGKVYKFMGILPFGTEIPLGFKQL